MKLAVFGGTGGTGGLVIAQAIEQGHSVTALVRDPTRMPQSHPLLTVLGGNPTVPDDVGRCVQGVDAVIHCLGIGGKGDGRPTTLVSDSVRVALAEKKKRGVPRIVCMSNIGAGGSGPWIVKRVVIPRFLRWLVPIIADKERMEAALRASPVEWVSVRLPSITSGPVKPVRASVVGRGLGLTITAASTARYLLDQARSTEWVRSSPSISN
mgnify:CR=1 FL=1